MLPEDARSKSGMASPAPIQAPGAPNQDLPPEQPAVPVQDK
jgi:general secretion pathway protein C